MENKTYIVKFTDAEIKALRFIVGNGWGDGNFAGYGGENKKTQLRAMKKLDEAKPVVKKTKNGK